ncbi:MAG TPA: VanZ family protein [Limnochordales bacterium]
MAEQAPAQAPVPARWRPLATWAGTLAYMAVLWWFSARPASVVSRWNFLDVPDFLLHAAAYLGLGVVAHWAFAARFRWPFLRTACAAVLLAGVYGIVDEFHQSFVPGRERSWQDVAADTCGAALGQLVLWAWPAHPAGQQGGAQAGGQAGERAGEWAADQAGSPPKEQAGRPTDKPAEPLTNSQAGEPPMG